MAVYEYQAETDAGELVGGNVTAADKRAAQLELESRGLQVVKLLLRPPAGEGGVLHDEELTTLVHAIGGAATNRVPLEVTLAALAEEKNDSRLADVAQQLASQLERGATVNQVLAGLDRQLPSDVVGLLRAGVDSGDLAGTFERFGQQRLATQRIDRRIRAAIAYPLIIIVILVPLLLFLSIFVIPMFGEMFEEFELELPVITEMVLQTSKQLPMLIAGLLGFCFRNSARLTHRWWSLAVSSRAYGIAPVGAIVDVVRPTRVCRLIDVLSQPSAADG